MIFGKTRLELKVGIFVFIGLVILAAFVFSIGGIKTWTQGYEVNFIFNFVNGVKIGAPVRLSGVDVGQVKRMDFMSPKEPGQTKVSIRCWIKKEVRIPLDSNVWVNTLGLLGEKYIEIMPGKETRNFLVENQDLAGEDPLPMQVVTNLAKKIADDLEDVIEAIKNKQGTIGRLLYEDAIYRDLEAFTADIRKHPWKLLFRTKEKKEKQ